MVEVAFYFVLVWGDHYAGGVRGPYPTLESCQAAASLVVDIYREPWSPAEASECYTKPVSQPDWDASSGL